LHDEVRILIFDEPAELEKPQRPPVAVKLSNPRGACRVGCMHGEKIRNPARERRTGAMLQLFFNQLDSMVRDSSD
jgi:hypothetical protein